MSVLEKLWSVWLCEIRLLVRCKWQLAITLVVPVLGGVVLGLAGTSPSCAVFIFLMAASVFLAAESNIPEYPLKGFYLVSKSGADISILGIQALVYTFIVGIVSESPPAYAVVGALITGVAFVAVARHMRTLH